MHHKEKEGSPAAVSWTEGEERAREAIERWRVAPGSACLLHGPAGAGKTALCMLLVAEASERVGVRTAAVQVGRAGRFASEPEILASLLEQLGDDVLRPPRDVLKLRSELRNRLANGQEEDEPEALLVLDGLDECVDWPREARVSTLQALGKRVRCLVSIAGGEGDAHAWGERLGWKAGDALFVEVAPPSPAAAERRGIPSWAAAGGNGGPEALAAQVERELRLLREERSRWRCSPCWPARSRRSMQRMSRSSWRSRTVPCAVTCSCTDRSSIGCCAGMGRRARRDSSTRRCGSRGSRGAPVGMGRSRRVTAARSRDVRRSPPAAGEPTSAAMRAHTSRSAALPSLRCSRLPSRVG
ncbi:ATP-binding protein [Sorangium sp. So ce204]|uniref:ATP-binding protein n=1 Tax=Sorangium sp. So ce204 TaxID=3133288 RepID=UPI003F5E2B61